MKAEVVELLRCPASGDPFELEGVESRDGEISAGTLRCGCGESFEIKNGMADLTYPPRLGETDQMMKDEFDGRADRYDSDLEWQFEVFEEDPEEIRRRMVDLLELEPGMRVLEIGAGTGSDSVHILERIGPDGELFAQDISAPMLELAREKLDGSGALLDFHAGNASYLPFADDSFDAAYHFGALNFFSDKERALAEMTRVTREHRKVVIGDEGIAPWLRDRLFGKIMIKTNKNYEFSPPLEMLPEDVREVAVRWLLGDSFYCIDYRVGKGPLPQQLDLPMPRKGDTLRSRYYGTPP